MKPFYFLTASSAPFCMIHYKITIKMANETVHKGDVGSLSIKILFDGNKSSDKIDLTDQMEFIAGKVYSFFVTSHNIKDDIQSIRIIYKNELNMLRLKNPEIFVEFVEIQSMEYGRNLKFCPSNREPLVNSFVSEFKSEFCGI